MVVEGGGKSCFRAWMGACNNACLLDKDDVPIVFGHQAIYVMQPPHSTIDIDGNNPEETTGSDDRGDKLSGCVVYVHQVSILALHAPDHESKEQDDEGRKG